jgi:Ca-activated chloride channel family protein
MLTLFARPQLLWLLLLVPLVVGLAMLARRRWQRDAAHWSRPGLWSRMMPGFHGRRPGITVGLAALAVAGIALALAEPRWGTALETVEQEGADVVFVLDTSRSMAAQDVRPSRLEVAQAVARQMLEELSTGGVPIALVQAEGDGVTLAPLSLDHRLVTLMVAGLKTGSLPQPGTALVPALTRAYQLFQAGDGRRVVVLFSDGEDHRGGVAEQARRLAQAGVIVHTLGVGTPAGSFIPLHPGNPVAPLNPATAPPTAVIRDAAGEPVLSRLQESSLKALAEATGGTYQRVERADFDPTPLVREIQTLERAERSAATVERRRPRFQWLLTLAMLALVGLLFGGSDVSGGRREAEP